MLGSTEDREEAFFSLCESFETEKKKRKKKGRVKKKSEQAAALIQPSAIWPASLFLLLRLPVFLHCLYSPDCSSQHFSTTPFL